MFKGYLELGGVPLINTEATEAYLRNLAPGMGLRPVYGSTTLHIANEEGEYQSPVLDDAPWANPADPATHNFYGFYPIDVEGTDGIPLSATVTEYLGDGGAVGLQRRGTKGIRVSGLLVGANPLAVDAGLSWLGATLREQDCDGCTSGELRYFVADPDICDHSFGAVIPHRQKYDGIGVGTIRYAWQVGDDVIDDTPASVTWEGSFQEGVVFEWGASAPSTNELYELHGPVAPLRRNYAPNPTFATGTDGVVLAGTAAWLASGGVDGGSYVSSGPAPAATPVAYGAGGYGGGAYGSTTAAISMTTERSMAGAALLSVALRGSRPVRLRLLRGSVEFASATVTPGASWDRYVLRGTVPTSGLVTLEVSGVAGFDLDQVLLEVATIELPYFDGSSVEDERSIQWAGTPNASSSTSTWIGTTTMARGDSRFRPYFAVLAGSISALDLRWDGRVVLPLSSQLLPYERRMYDVSCTEGISIIREISEGSRGHYLQVEFTLTAGDSSPYTLPLPVDVTPISNSLYSDGDPAVGVVDTSWLSDPNAQLVSRPPSAPVIINPAIESISVWRRYYVPIPATAVGDWTPAIPTMSITSKADPITQVRVRFHPNPFNYPVTAVDPKSFCSEFIVSYLPALTRLEVDGVLESATATRGGDAALSADHLLYGADGAPISWPELSCGTPYVLTIDVPPTKTIDAFALDLAMRKRL